MKTMILVAAVAAFEFAFVVSIATPPSGPAAASATARSGEQRSGALAQRDGAQLPCTQLPCTPPG